MQTIERELKSINCGQKSFYQKAHVVEYYDEIKGVTTSMHLKSYNTIVCSININGDHLQVVCECMYSKTTKRHIKDFIIQNIGLQAWAIIENGHNNGQTIWTF